MAVGFVRCSELMGNNHIFVVISIDMMGLMKILVVLFTVIMGNNDISVVLCSKLMGLMTLLDVYFTDMMKRNDNLTFLLVM